MLSFFYLGERGRRMSDLQNLENAIFQAGFDAFAIMPVTSLNNMLPILEKAMDEDRYPAFVDRDIQKRINPLKFQKSAKSIISLAISYNTGHAGPTPSLHGTISRSAWGKDYHNVLNRRMDKIINYLKTDFGAKECSKAVDTSFLIDRALAIEAGMGFPGSNCAVYVPPFGSWVFLSEILVDVKLPTTKKPDQCNWSEPVKCTACVKACPTGALVSPGTIDAKRCLSYLTQKSGSIPMEFRDKLGYRLWGCDTCQQACGINQKAPLTKHKEFEPIVGPHFPLLTLLEMDKNEFNKVFSATSIAWRGKNILQRNACIVLGNHKDPEALPILEETTRNHPSDMVREAARWGMDKIQRYGKS